MSICLHDIKRDHRENEHGDALVLRLLVVLAAVDLLRDDRQPEEVEAADGHARFFRVACHQFFARERGAWSSGRWRWRSGGGVARIRERPLVSGEIEPAKFPRI